MKEDPPTAPPPINRSSILPLAVGNSWIGVFTFYNTDGSVFTSRSDTISIIEKKTPEWYRFSDGKLLKQEGKGVYQSITASQSGPASSLLFKFPAVAGDIYADTLQTVLGTDEIITNKVIATDAKVMIGSTTYSCYHYVQTATSYPAILITIWNRASGMCRWKRFVCSTESQR